VGWLEFVVRGEEPQIADRAVAGTACFGLMRAKPCGCGPIVDLPVQPLLQKYFGFLLTQITGLSSSSRPKRGAFRDRHEREAGCGGRFDAGDEQRESGRRSRVALTPRRWRQVGKGDFASDGGNQARSPAIGFTHFGAVELFRI
jgi:hypothetical protein